MLVLLWGTRPEAIKLGPIAAALRFHGEPFVSLATGQHTTLLQGTPAETDLADSESLCLAATGDTMRWLHDAWYALRHAFRRLEPSLVVVQGDTMSAMAGARAAQALRIPVAHVEAGVRSGDLANPFPEEGYRRQITQLATWHFAPTGRAWQNLVDEGVSSERIWLTGNPVVSAIARYAAVEPNSHPDTILVFTMHRREWYQHGILSVLDGFLEAVVPYPKIEVVWPIHPAVASLVPREWIQALPSHVRVMPPLPYRPMLRLLASSMGCATDSGGLQEECAVLGVPCAVLRHVTDRPESVEAGVAQLFAPNRQGVIDAFSALRNFAMPRKPVVVYGSPRAADAIATELAHLVSPSAMPNIGCTEGRL